MQIDVLSILYTKVTATCGACVKNSNTDVIRHVCTRTPFFSFFFFISLLSMIIECLYLQVEKLLPERQKLHHYQIQLDWAVHRYRLVIASHV